MLMKGSSLRMQHDGVEDKNDEEPVVGQPFRGAGIVTRIDNEDKEQQPDYPWKVSRKIVTMTSGIIFLVDLYVDNAVGVVTDEKKTKIEAPKAKEEIVATKSPRQSLKKRSSDGESSFPTKSREVNKPDIADLDSSSKATATATVEGSYPPEPIRENSSDSSLPSAGSEVTTPEIPGLPESPTGNRRTTSTVERNQYDSKPAEVPMSIFVHAKNDPDLPSIIRQVEDAVALSNGSPDSSDEQPRYGIWAFHEDDALPLVEKEDIAFWKPQRVTLWLDANHPLDTIPEASEDDGANLSGVWGFIPYGNNRFEAGGDRDTSLQHILVVPPRHRIPHNFVQAGRYTLKTDSSPVIPTRDRASRLDATWPPPVDHIRKQLHRVGKLKMPTCFEENDKKVCAKVFPKSKLHPYSKQPEVLVTKGGESVKPPMGHWEYPKGQETEDDYFLPVDVDLYWGKDKPRSRESSRDSTDESASSWGLWGTSSADASICTISDDGWQPERPIVFPPGLQPDPHQDIAILGRWAYRTNQNTSLEWPPRSVKLATVYASYYSPGMEPGKPKGIWRFPGMDDVAVKECWDPVEVELLGGHESCSHPSGAWGIRKSADPDHNHDWEPHHVDFYPPDVTPSSDTLIQGKWTLKTRGVGNLQASWPPPATKKASALKSFERLSLSRWPKEAWVHPIQRLPRRLKHEGFLGAWKITHDDEPENSVWKPQQVHLHGISDPIDASMSFGYWGVNAALVGLDDTNDVLPEDIWFYPPGQKPPESECTVHGKWTFQSSKLGRSWPPPQVSPITSPRRSVAKLKIPEAFVSEASPAPRDGGKPKLPSLFSHYAKSTDL